MMKRIPLGLYPTPLQELTYFSTSFGEGRHLFMKREDLVGVGFGGNKIRRLEYYLGVAMDKGGDCLVIAGGSKSNQTIAAAACAAKAGLPAYLVIPAATGTVTRSLAELLQVEIYYTDDGQTTTLNRGIRTVCNRLKEEGRRPYIIRPGAALPLGILGYVDAMQELYEQAAARHIIVDHVLCCGGTGNTYAVVLLGTKLFSPHTTATALAIGRRFKHASTLCQQIAEAAALGGYACPVNESDVHIRFTCGQGAGQPMPKGREAMKLMASHEGIFLDPLFTGKAFAGLLAMQQEGCFPAGANIVFINTGGAITLLGSFH